LWSELDARGHLAPHLDEALSPTRRVVKPTFETLLQELAEQGTPVLVRYAERDAEEVAASREDVAAKVAELRVRTAEVLRNAQRHATDGEVVGLHAWDPEHDGPAVRALLGAGLLSAPPGQADPAGRFLLHPDLPDAPGVAYDFTEAAMDLTDDLSEPQPSVVTLLHDLAALAAALQRVSTRRTVAGSVMKQDARKLGRQLGAKDLAKSGRFDEFPRWSRALRALGLLRVVSTDPIKREIFLDDGLDQTLAGTTADAVDRFLHRVVERDLHVLLPAVRQALTDAGNGAVDQLVFVDELRLQHRDVVFPRWLRDGIEQYPGPDGAPGRPWDDDNWERVEGKMVGVLLKRLDTLGLVRRAPGVFAATEDGRLWAGVPTHPPPPVWVSSDLEITVPPGSVTPWERFQLERLGPCIARDVVDRYRLERPALVQWLEHHDEEQAIALLQRRSPAVPSSVVTTIRTWATSARRFVLTRGVLLP
jgi:hypothetical protein